MQKKQGIGIVKKLDFLEKQASIVYLSIGSNLGNRIFNIEKTKYLISTYKINIIQKSSYYDSPSWPNEALPRFLNVVIKKKTYLNLINLFKILKKIEKQIGRKKSERNDPRVCDIDIIDFNGMNLITKVRNNNIIVPHERMMIRNFVLIPLLEVNKNWKHPKTKVKIVKLVSNLKISSIRGIKVI